MNKKNQIIQIINKRKDLYGYAILKTVLTKEQAEWKNSLTLVQVLQKNEEPIRDEIYRYPNCIVSKKCLNLDELIKMVEELVTNKKFSILGLEIPFEGFFYQDYPEYVESNYEIFKLNWPANVFSFKQKAGAPHPREPFIAIDAPIFPGSWEVLQLWTGLDTSRSVPVGSIVFLLPNYNARIEELRLSSGILTIKIVTNETSIDRIVGKLYCEKSGGRVLQKDVSFDQNIVTVPLDFIPDRWHFYILFKDTGDILDFRKIYSSWSSLPAGVIVEIRPSDIEEIISRGENERVEFKQDWFKKPEEFIETVVAFANTCGGSIFVGVDDNGKVVGVEHDKLEEGVQSRLRDTCEPMPEVRIEKKEIQGKTIWIIQVAEGKDKPYNYKNRGFFIRVGSTDRLISRIEMENIYRKERSPYPSM